MPTTVYHDNGPQSTQVVIKVTLLSAVDMSHLICITDTELANSPRPWGQERAERVLGLGLACCHHSQANTTQTCI